MGGAGEGMEPRLFLRVWQEPAKAQPEKALVEQEWLQHLAGNEQDEDGKETAQGWDTDNQAASRR